MLKKYRSDTLSRKYTKQIKLVIYFLLLSRTVLIDMSNAIAISALE